MGKKKACCGWIKTVLAIIAALAAIAAIAALIIAYKEQITRCIGSLGDKLKERKRLIKNPDYEDFADV